MNGPGVAVRVGAICLLDDALLLARHGLGPAGGEWRLPEVLLRPGEALAEAVVRACWEHARYEALCGPFVGWNERPEAAPPTVELFFEAVPLDAQHSRADAPQPTGTGAEEADDGPVAEARFVPRWEVSELRLATGLAEFLADVDVIDTVV